MGVNIRAGAHYTQFMVYDFNGDGKAEMAVKTAPGTKMTTFFADGRVKEEKYITMLRRIWRPAVPMRIIMSAVRRITESIWRRFSRSGRSVLR